MSESLTRRKFMSSTAGLAAGTAASLVGRAAGAASPVDSRPANPKKPRIKIGQIGVGHAHAEGKMRSYRESDDYEVVGVVEPDPELRKSRSQRPGYQGVPWMTQEQLLGTKGLQAVAIETQVRDLLDSAEACVDAGVHIHLDKPAGSSLPQFRHILKTAASKGRIVQMGYMYRYNPAIVLMRDLLKKGWLGEPFEIHTVMSKVVGQDSRRELADYPGGIMFELGCHIIDLTVGVLGRPSKVTPYVRQSSPQNDGLLDNMLAVFEYPRAVATVKSTAQEVEGFARRHFVVCGTEGTFHVQPLDSPSARLALSRERGTYKKGYQEIKFPRYTRYIDDARDLAMIIRGEKESDFPPEHDDAVQETVLKASNLPLD